MGLLVVALAFGDGDAEGGPGLAVFAEAKNGVAAEVTDESDVLEDIVRFLSCPLGPRRVRRCCRLSRSVPRPRSAMGVRACGDDFLGGGRGVHRGCLAGTAAGAAGTGWVGSRRNDAVRAGQAMTRTVTHRRAVVDVGEPDLVDEQFQRGLGLGRPVVGVLVMHLASPDGLFHLAFDTDDVADGGEPAVRPVRSRASAHITQSMDACDPSRVR